MLHLVPRKRSWSRTVAPLAVLVVAFAARCAWVRFVDSPYDNIFSDMAGYVNRAMAVAWGGNPFPTAPTSVVDPHAAEAAALGLDPWTARCTYYPPGGHLLYAAEMRLLGWSHHLAMLGAHCLWGAAVAPCATLIAFRVTSRVWLATLTGLAVALWYPLVAYSGFFSSEQLYAPAMAASTWFLVRQIDRGKGAVALGVASSIAYLVRPQILLTLAALALVGLLVLVGFAGRRAPRLRVSQLVVAGAIFSATVGWGAWRYHALSGRWGIISDNGALGRLAADTDYSRVQGRWKLRDGTVVSYVFESPPRMQLGLNRELAFDGYVGDPVQLTRARLAEVRHMRIWTRVARWVENVSYLFTGGVLWPVKMDGWRRQAYDLSQDALLFGLWPLAGLGMLACARRPTLVSLVCTAHILTAIVCAAFFTGEQRYRVPYDTFAFLLALDALCRAWRWARRARLRRRASVRAQNL